MRIFFIGCLTLLGIMLCITDFSYGHGLAYFSVLEHGYGFAWNLLILFVGVATGSYLMQDLVQEGQENYNLYRNMFSKWESTRDKWKALEDKFISLQLERDELRLARQTHVEKLKRLEDVQDMIQAVERQYGGRGQTTVDLTSYREIKASLWKDVFGYGK